MTSAHPAAECAAIYVRRSHKDAEGDARNSNGRSLKEQEAECRALAARMGLDVVHIYSEREGTGASSLSRKARPEWDRALAGLAAGDTFRTLIVWDLDRADRRGWAALAPLFGEHAKKRDRRIVDTHGLDTSDRGQKWGIMIRSEMAAEEAEKTGERVRRSRMAARESGAWEYGRPPLGLKAVNKRLVHDPETYPLARRIAEEALAGRTPYAISTGLNAEGIKASRGGDWRASSVLALLRAPGFAGLVPTRARAESGIWTQVAEPYLDAAGRPVRCGEGVITEAERIRILALYGDRVTADNRGRRTPGVPALLRGLVFCASCGSFARMSGARRGRSYGCAARGAGSACPGFTAPEDRVDDAVVDTFLRYLAVDPEEETDEARLALLVEVGRRWAIKADPEAEVARIRLSEALTVAEADVARVTKLLVSGVLEEEEAAEHLPGLRARRDALRADIAALPDPEGDISPLLDLTQSREAWDALPVDERRSLLALAIDRVTVSRAPGRGAAFYPGERVLVHWVNPPGGTTPAGARRKDAEEAPERLQTTPS